MLEPRRHDPRGPRANRRAGHRKGPSRAIRPLRAGILAAILPLVAAFPPQNAVDLMRRHLEALGGPEAVRAVAAVLARGEIEIVGSGLRGTIESRSARPCLASSEIALGYFRIRQGYDGRRIWMIDPNGKLQIRRDPASIEYQRTICALESRDYVFGGEGLSVESSGRDTVDGVPCEVVAISVEGGAPCRLFIDSATHLIRRAEIRAPEGLAIQGFDDYRPVSGVMFPFFERTEVPSIGQRIEIRYSEITPYAPVDPVDFVPPPASARDYRFTEGRASASMPFEYRNRHIFVPARIEGREREVLFLLDSGASMTVIDSTIAVELGLPFGGVIPGSGAGGIADFHMTRIPGLRLDGIELSEQTVVAFPIAGLLQRYEEAQIGGILGYDFLSRFVTRIDYERRVVTFFEPDSFAPRGGETAIDAPLVRNIFSVPAGLDEASRALFLLDTGATNSFVRGDFARVEGIVEGKRTLEIVFRGAGGEEKAALCRFDSLVIEGIAIRDPVLAVTAGSRGPAGLENVHGLVGNDVLERFTVTFDYRGQRVLLERNGRFGEPFYRDRSGLQLARGRDRRIMIVGVVPESPAARAGLRPGDVIVRIDRTRSERFATLREAIALFEREDGTTCRVEIERGGKKREVALTLERYL